MSARAPVKVLYIMGAGHIGSTVVDVVLGHHPRLESLGEILKFHRFGWAADPKRNCSCGQTVHGCPFWSEVRERWIRDTGDVGGARQLALQSAFEDSRAGWPRILLNRLRPGAAFRDYQQGTASLYRAVQEVGGKEILIDSSLRPRRALALTENPAVDLHLIHMVRDGRGVMWSLMKPNKKTLTRTYRPAPPLRTARYWVSANLQSRFIYSLVPPNKRLLLRYEDFAERPEEALSRIGGLVGIDLSNLLDGFTVRAIGGTRHTVAGNRIRMESEIMIRSDFAWMKNLEERHRRLFWRVAGWLARGYGYRERQESYGA